MRHPHRRAPLRAIPFLAILALSVVAASPPVPGKRGPQAPRYGRAGSPTSIENIFHAGVSRAPTQGAQSVNVLAVRVAFSDTPIDSSTAYYNRLLFFLNQYWNQMSDGQVTLSTTLADSVFTLPKAMAYYGDDDHYQERLVFMIRDMVAAADSTIDFRSYQSIVIFHGGQGQEADVLDNSRDQIWSSFVTQEDFKTVLPDTTGQGKVGIPTNDMISPGVPYYVKEGVILPESESQDGYVFGMTGVVCHEFGHQLGTLRGQVGMPDLYDTTPDQGGYGQGLGSFDIMAGGVWNANGFVPAGISAWTRVWLGFVQPTRVTLDGPQTISELERQVGTSPRVIQVPITQSEYFLIENRQHDLDGDGKFTFDDVNHDGCFDFYTDSYAGAEYDFFLPANLSPPSGVGCDAGTYLSGSGILIYHVDDAKIQATLVDNVVEGDNQRKGIDIEEANGIQDLDDPPTSLGGGSPDDVFRAGWRNQFTPTTNPSTAAYPNVGTGISITDISAADSVMTFNVSFDRTRPGWPKIFSGRIRALPAVAADLDGDGKKEILVAVQRLNNTGAIYIFRADGTNYLGGGSTPTPFVVTGSAPTSSPCVGDIDGAPGPEIVFETLDGSIYALHTNGTEVMDGDANPSTLGILVKGTALTSSHAQPILADLNGDGLLDIITGGSTSPVQQGGSTLRVVSLAGGVRNVLSLPMGGSTEGPPAAVDLDGDGLPEIVIANVATIDGDNAASGLSIANWDILNDSGLPHGADQYALFLFQAGGPYSSPVMADLNRDGKYEISVADANGSYHAFQLQFGSHVPGDPPSDYVHAFEISGWPVSLGEKGRISEVSLGDLEHDGYPEIFHEGDQVRVEAFHYNGAPRSGYPVQAAAPFAAEDSMGFWPPLIADVDGDGKSDVIVIAPDGRRPAYRGDGSAIEDFVELGSTGASAPPMLVDLDGDGLAEWVETYDANTIQATVTVRTPPVPVMASTVVWGQYRNSATRNAVLQTGPAGPGGGTSNLSAVYAYPNPSRSGTTTIHYRLAEAATSASIRIIDPVGATVADLPVTLADLAGSAEHAVTWTHGRAVSGVYLCRVEVKSSRGTEVQFASLAVVR